MDSLDKNLIVDAFDDINEGHFLHAKLEVLSRIRTNLVNKIHEIDGKISKLKQEYTQHPDITMNDRGLKQHA